MSSRPLTPPCIPFGTRRFRPLKCNVSARTGPGCHNIRLGRAVCLLFNMLTPGFPISSSSPVWNFPIGMPATSVLPIYTDFEPLFWVSSIVSRCTCGIFFSATHSRSALSASCPLYGNSQSIHEYRPSRFP